MTVVSEAEIASASAAGTMRCSVVGCSSMCGCLGCVDCCDWVDDLLPDLFPILDLSASLNIPVSQSGSSPTVLASPAMGTWCDAGNCADAGGGTVCAFCPLGDTLPTLKAMVAASCMGGCWGMAGGGWCILAICSGGMTWVALSLCNGCCGEGVTGRTGAGADCICWSINSTWATLSFQPRLRKKPSKALKTVRACSCSPNKRWSSAAS